MREAVIFAMFVEQVRAVLDSDSSQLRYRVWGDAATVGFGMRCHECSILAKGFAGPVDGAGPFYFSDHGL